MTLLTFLLGTVYFLVIGLVTVATLEKDSVSDSHSEKSLGTISVLNFLTESHDLL